MGRKLKCYIIRKSFLFPIPYIPSRLNFTECKLFSTSLNIEKHFSLVCFRILSCIFQIIRANLRIQMHKFKELSNGLKFKTRVVRQKMPSFQYKSTRLYVFAKNHFGKSYLFCFQWAILYRKDLSCCFCK